MKWLLRIGLALLVLIAIAGVAAVLVLPGLVDSPEVRSRIERAARDATGRSLVYDSLEFGLLPPSLRVLGASVSGERPRDEPLLEAGAVSLRVELLPLLVGAVVIDSLVIDAATLRLERRAEGLVLPRPPEPAEETPRSAAAPAAEKEDAGSSFSLGIRSVELRDATLELRDRAVSPGVDWRVSELDASARGSSLSQPIDLDLAGRLESGGGLAAHGSVTTGGELDLELELDALELAPLAPYLGGDTSVSGALSGKIGVQGPAAALDRLVADLRGRDVRFQQGENALSGELALEAEVASPTGAAAGSFEVDATAASLSVGGGFTKPPGVPATVTGRIASGKDGALAIDDVRLVIRNLEARGRVGSLSPLRVELSAPPFELAGWEALVPALAEARPTGRIALEGLRFASGATPDLRGTVKLDAVSVQPREGAGVTLRGAIVGEGRSLSSVDTTLETAGQVSDLDLKITELFGTPRYQVKLVAREADSNQLLTGLLAKPDTVYGPLGLDLALGGTLAGDPLASLSGNVDFGVEPGRIVGVSLLRQVFDRLGSVGSLAVDLGQAFGGRDLQRFYGDEFELLKGGLRVGEGVARTRDGLVLRYRGYAVRLDGTLGLLDLGLDMSGELTIKQELDAVIASGLKLRDYQPRPRTIPLAHVRGTLGAPKVSIDPVVATRFAAAYAGDAYAGKLREKAEKELGPGGGALVDQGLGVLQGILGGGRRQEAPPQAPEQKAPPPAGP